MIHAMSVIMFNVSVIMLLLMLPAILKLVTVLSTHLFSFEHTLLLLEINTQIRSSGHLLCWGTQEYKFETTVQHGKNVNQLASKV